MSTLGAEVITYITDYTTAKGIAQVDPLNNDYVKYLNMPEEDLARFSKEDCAIAQFVLNQYLASLTQQTSRIQNLIKVNQYLLSKRVGLIYPKYVYNTPVPHSFIIDAIYSSDIICTPIVEENLKLESLYSELHSTIEYISKLCASLNALSWAKGKE